MSEQDWAGTADTVQPGEHPAAAAALTRLEALDGAPLEKHAEIYEEVRQDLRTILDAE